MEVLPYELRLNVYEIYRCGLRKRQLERILRFPVRQKSWLYDLGDHATFVIGLREENFRWEFNLYSYALSRQLWVNGRKVSYERFDTLAK